MRLSIVVPVYNRKKITIDFLKLLQKQTFTEFNTIVVDDGSQDGTEAAIREKFPEVHVLKGSGNWWWTKSVNEGIKYALTLRSQVVLLMNDDTFFKPDYLEKLLVSANANPGCIIGSLSLTYEKPKRIFFSGIKQIKILSSGGCRYHPQFELYKGGLSGNRVSIALPGRGLLIPMSIIEKYGYFDEKKLPQYGADEAYITKIYRQFGQKSYISWDAIIYCYTAMTGKGASFSNESMTQFIKSFFTPKSRQYIPDKWNMSLVRFGKIKGVGGFCFSILRSFYGYVKRRNQIS